MTLILSSVGLYIFANRKAYAWRYVYPVLPGWGCLSSSADLHHRDCLY
ncbi:MAG: hypothetical protein ACLTXH_12760 [Enterobacter hormaechei]